MSGGIIYAAASGTGFEGTFKAVVQDGLITNLSNAYNVGILAVSYTHLDVYKRQPYECYEQFHVRKYGFHGTSHRFVSMKYGEVTGKSLEGLNIVSCHLGNGSSITAIKDGKSVDTSMGFTPLDGIIMGTRSGSVDPSAV